MGECYSRFGIVRERNIDEVLEVYKLPEISEQQSSKQETITWVPPSNKESGGQDAEEDYNTNSQVEERLLYIEEISRSKAWVIHSMTDSLLVRTLSGSMYHDSLPVLQIILTFTSEIPNVQFLHAMNEKRSTWDKYRRNEVITLQGDPSIVKFTFPFPVRNRKIWEKVYRYEDKNSCQVLSHSVDSPVQLSHDEEQGFVFFSLIELKRYSGKSTVTFTSQVDLKLPPTKRSEELISKMGSEWASLCFKVLNVPHS